LVLAGNDRLLARVDREGSGIASHLPLSIADRDIRFIRIGVSIDSVFARTVDREGEVRSIDLKILIAIQPANAYVQTSL